MASVLGLDHDIELGAFDRSVVEQALVVHLDDVAGVFADHSRQAREGAGHVGQLATQADEPALAHEAAHQDRGEQPRVQIAAGDHDPDPAAAKPLGLGEHGGETGRPGALSHELLSLEQDLNGAFEHDLVDEPDFGYQLLYDAAGQPARFLNRDPFGERRSRSWWTRVFATEQTVHRGV